LQVYLDNAATTRPINAKTWETHIQTAWHNPSAAYGPAADVFIGLKDVRERLQSTLAFGSDVVFTSGGTEANNTALLSAFKKGAHYVTSAVEHPSVYETFRRMEEMGAAVDYIRPRSFCISAEDVAQYVREDTALVSVMHVNNETGAVNDIAAIAQAVKAKNPKTRFHSDGVQALLKLPVSLAGSGIDYYTVSAHKIGGLKGTGALLTGENVPLGKLHYGGEQEYSLRPGTENTLGIQVFGEALVLGAERFDTTLQTVTALRGRLTAGLAQMDGAALNEPAQHVPHIVNVSFEGVRAEVLVRVLGEKGVYIGTGAACSRGKISRVLLESGVQRSLAEGAVRISMSGDNTEKDIDVCLEQMTQAVKDLRKFGRR